MKRMIQLRSFAGALLCVMIGLACQSCQSYSDSRIVKKFLSRYNAKEFDSASTYIYPDDLPAFQFYTTQVKRLAPHAYVKLKDYKTEGDGDDRHIEAVFQWKNATPALRNYFAGIGQPIDSDGLQKVTIRLRQTNDGEYISLPFRLPGSFPTNPKVANATKDHSISVYNSPNDAQQPDRTTKGGVIVGNLNNGWYEAFTLNDNGELRTQYIKKDNKMRVTTNDFFHLGILDSLGVILALVLIVVILVPMYLMRGFIGTLFSDFPIGGPLTAIALILGTLYVIYQLLEQVLFELFIINLPY